MTSLIDDRRPSQSFGGQIMPADLTHKQTRSVDRSKVSQKMETCDKVGDEPMAPLKSARRPSQPLHGLNWHGNHSSAEDEVRRHQMMTDGHQNMVGDEPRVHLFDARRSSQPFQDHLWFENSYSERAEIQWHHVMTGGNQNMVGDEPMAHFIDARRSSQPFQDPL